MQLAYQNIAFTHSHESLLEGIELLPDGSLEVVVHVALTVVLSVVFSYTQVLSIGGQFSNHYFSQDVSGYLDSQHHNNNNNNITLKQQK